VLLRDGFNANGAVWLLGAKIGGQLDCSGATLTNENGHALFADRAEINGHVFLRDGFSATGEVRLLGAKIGGELDCSGATLSNEGGDALFANGAEINGGVYLGHGFSATGGVRLLSAKIGGQLDCSGATLVSSAGIALAARDATIRSALIFRDVRVTGGVDLFRAGATTLDDDLGLPDHPLGSWQEVQPLILDSFAYARFGHEAEWDSKFRRQWLDQSSGFQQGALAATHRGLPCAGSGRRGDPCRYRDAQRPGPEGGPAVVPPQGARRPQVTGPGSRASGQPRSSSFSPSSFGTGRECLFPRSKA
jgi:hypothetical protein